jgi:hypothetical protein
MLDPLLIIAAMQKLEADVLLYASKPGHILLCGDSNAHVQQQCSDAPQCGASVRRMLQVSTQTMLQANNCSTYAYLVI